MRYLRRADANKGVVITLAVVIVLIGGFWAYRGLSREQALGNPDLPELKYWVICDECNNRATMTNTQIKELSESESGDLQCPKCEKFAAHVERMKGGTALTPRGG